MPDDKPHAIRNIWRRPGHMREVRPFLTHALFKIGDDAGNFSPFRYQTVDDRGV